jgi:DNA topoisomerase IB
MVRLRTVSTEMPGWTRRRAGRGFVYLDEHGARLPDEDAARVRALVIPPAWQEVWVCPVPNGHLQAVGTDEAGRRQYLYHPAWRERRDLEKYERVSRLGRVLAEVRSRLVTDLGGEGMSRERASAIAVRLLDLGYFRVGNDVYTDQHGSFGLTSLERRHVRRRGDTLVFEFTGKSGVDHVIEIDDALVLAAIDILRRRRSTTDLALLAFKDGRRWRRLDPTLLNDYVRQVTELEVSAKDFRTWHATVLAAVALADSVEPGDTAASRKRAVSSAMKEVSSYLGNTPTIARSSYVDPRVLDLYEQGRTITPSSRRRALDPEEQQAATERAVLRLLRSP